MRLFFFLCLFSVFYLGAQEFPTADSLRTIETQSVSIIGLQTNFIGGSATRISPAQLEKLNQNDINKVLRSVPGVQIRDEEGFGLRPNIGMRGTPVNRSAKITLMEDGILIAPAPYADPSAYYFPTFARIASLEVLKGSSQIKHGPYTIGGALNLHSTKIPLQFSAFGQGSYGSFGMNQERFWVGETKGQLSYLFELNRVAATGFKQLDGGGNTGFDRRDYLGKIRWQSASKAKVQQSLQLKILHTEEQSNETYLGLTYSDFIANPLRRYAGTQKDQLNLWHNHLILQHVLRPLKNLQISSSAYLTKTFRDWGRAYSFGTKSINAILADPLTEIDAYNIMVGQADGEVVFRSAARTYFTRGIQTYANYEFKTGAVLNKLELGFRLHQDLASRYGTQSTYYMNNAIMLLTDGGEQGNQENQIRSGLSFASFVNYKFEWQKWGLSAGVRNEQIILNMENFGNNDFSRSGSSKTTAQNNIFEWLPGVSLDYGINAEQLLFVGAHKGFSPPGMPSANQANQARAEKAINYEFGYRYCTKRNQIQAVIFRSAYQNLLGSDNISGGGAGSGEQFNAGQANIQGFELSLQKQIQLLTVSIPIKANYTYTQALFSETFINGGGDWGSGIINTGDQIPFIAPHLLGMSAGVETKNCCAMLSANYVSATRIKPSQGALVVPTLNQPYSSVNCIPAYLLLDLSVQYQLNATWKTYLSVQNMANNQNAVANLPQGYRPAMPRAFILGFKMQL